MREGERERKSEREKTNKGERECVREGHTGSQTDR